MSIPSRVLWSESKADLRPPGSSRDRSRAADGPVLADFTEEGFDLVARIHREEGTEHPRSAVTVGSASAALLRAGMRHLGGTTGHLQDVACFGRTTSAET